MGKETDFFRSVVKIPGEPRARAKKRRTRRPKGAISVAYGPFGPTPAAAFAAGRRPPGVLTTLLRTSSPLPGRRPGSRRLVRALALAQCCLLGAGMDWARADAFTESDPEIDKGPKVYGYIQFQVINQPIDTNGDDEVNEGRSRVQRARLSVEGDINRYVSYEMDIDPRAPEVNGKLRDAFFDVQYRKNHVLRLGQHKTKFGYENQVSSSRLYVVNRSEMADEMARGINLRDQGVSFIGKWALGAKSRLNYAFSIVNGAGMNVQRDNNKKKSLWGRVGIRTKSGDTKWRLGFSAGKADRYEPPEDGEPGFFIDFKSYGTDFLIDTKRLMVNGEFAIGPMKEMGEEETVHAYYLLLVGKMAKPYGPLLRYDSFNTDEFQRWTVGAYYGRPNDAVRVLFNYEFRFEEDDIIDNAADDRLYLWTQVRF